MLLSFTQLTSSSIVNAFLKLSRHKKVCSFSIELTCCVACLGLKKFQMPFRRGFKAGGTHIFPKATSDVTKFVHNFLNFLEEKIWKKLTMLKGIPRGKNWLPATCKRPRNLPQRRSGRRGL